VYLTTEQCLDAIERHTRGLAEAADGSLDRAIEHCPDWSMADLVWHVAGVHRFWEHVARERPLEQPSRPEVSRPVDRELVPTLLAGLDVLLATLRAADQAAPCWTWGLQEEVGFITRHQVQEAAVHHWDAANAVGRQADWEMRPVDAVDSVDEFLTHSVGNRRWQVDDADPLGGALRFRPRVAEGDPCPTWTIRDGPMPGTVGVTVDEPADADGDQLVIGGPVDPARLLLWLYGRVPYDDPEIFDGAPLTPAGRWLALRFKALTFSD
jgi:uncharacterized protein (TIGR03083 family)